MKKFRFHIIITLVIAFAALAIPKAEGSMNRGIYVNSQVHYLSVGADAKHQTLSHQAGTVDSNFLLTLGTAVTQNVGSCTPDCGGVSMNGAVFDQKIFFAFTGNPGCTTNKTTGMPSTTHLYVAAWDLTTGDFAKDTSGAYTVPKDLGAVQHTDSNSAVGYSEVIDMASAAIVVFDNLLYVFSDNGTYTSGDGVNWSSYPALSVGGTNMEPLDAITFYPADADPLIMIIYGNYTTNYSSYGSLYAATWNGLFGASSVLNGQNIGIAETSGSAYFNHSLGLYAGTASPAFTLQPGNNPPGFSAGAKTPSLQLFLGAQAIYSTTNETSSAVRRLEYTYSTTGGRWTVDPEVLVPNGGYGYTAISAFPWFTNECTADNNIQRQHLVINTSYPSLKLTQNLPFTSDAMVPQNTDIPLSCQSSGGTGTNTGTGNSVEQATLRKYWTLVGVVMGSPPFNRNGAVDTDIEHLSNVTYGQSSGVEVSNSQETSNAVLVSAGLTLQAGMEHKFGIQDQVDSSYKHAWESAHETSTTSTVSYGLTLGTESASTDPGDYDQLGMMGWAIFHVPTIVVQDYALYAYDYVTATNIGTPLNQDVHTTQTNPTALSYRQVAFELANPGGPNDDIPGLMTGVVPLTQSTDFLNGWTTKWESSSTNSTINHFITLLGDTTAGEKGINTISFGTGSNGSVSFSQDIQTVTTTGQTSDVDVSNQTSLDIGTELNGFKADLKAGYDGHFSNSVTNTATLGSDVEAALVIPACYSDPSCIKTMTIQPYLLQATDNQAPWVPTGYNSQLPWAIHWTITSGATVGGQQFGFSAQADQASGTIVGGSAKGSDGSGGSSYSLVGGKMVWQEDEWTLKRIPMTAQQFDPTSGVSVKLNGYTWSSPEANGAWTRQGNVWTFRTNNSVQSDIVVLKLDFGGYTWDFNLSKADLSTALGASEGRAHVKLKVNNKYTFYFDAVHEVESHWDHYVPAKASEEAALSLSHYSGSYDPSTGNGTAVLEGTLPANLEYFGDMSFLVNGRQFNVPLLSHPDYARALANGEKLVYPYQSTILKKVGYQSTVLKKLGLHVSIDFGKKTWTARFNGKIDPLLAPRLAKANIQVKVGGELWYSGDHAIQHYTLKLK